MAEQQRLFIVGSVVVVIVILALGVALIVPMNFSQFRVLRWGRNEDIAIRLEVARSNQPGPLITTSRQIATK